MRVRFSRNLILFSALLLLLSCLSGCRFVISPTDKEGNSVEQTLRAEIHDRFGFEVDVRRPAYWRDEIFALTTIYRSLLLLPDGLAKKLNDYYYGYRRVIAMCSPEDNDTLDGEFDPSFMEENGVLNIHLYSRDYVDWTFLHEMAHYLVMYVWDRDYSDLTEEFAVCNDTYEYFGDEWDSDEAHAEEYAWVYISAYAGMDAEEDFCELFSYMIADTDYVLGLLDEQPDSVLAEKVRFIEFTISGYTDTVMPGDKNWWVAGAA